MTLFQQPSVCWRNRFLAYFLFCSLKFPMVLCSSPHKCMAIWIRTLSPLKHNHKQAKNTDHTKVMRSVSLGLNRSAKLAHCSVPCYYWCPTKFLLSVKSGSTLGQHILYTSSAPFLSSVSIHILTLQVECVIQENPRFPTNQYLGEKNQ